jgi:hypothetical protein
MCVAGERVQTSCKVWGIEGGTTSFWRHFGQFLGSRGDDVLSCSVSNHERGIVKSTEDALFDICNDFRSSAEDETGVVLEEIISDCTYTILLVWHCR